MWEVLFEVERSQSRYEVEMLRGAADKLEADESLTLSAGSEDRTQRRVQTGVERM